MVVEFQQAKSLWHQWIDESVDHAFQLSQSDPLLHYFKSTEPDKLHRLLVTPGDPTTEMLAVCFKAKLQCFLSLESLPLICTGVEISETPTNVVTFQGNPQQHLPAQGWWNRADLSINDFGGVAVSLVSAQEKPPTTRIGG